MHLLWTVLGKVIGSFRSLTNASCKNRGLLSGQQWIYCIRSYIRNCFRTSSIRESSVISLIKTACETSSSMSYLACKICGHLLLWRIWWSPLRRMVSARTRTLEYQVLSDEAASAPVHVWCDDGPLSMLLDVRYRLFHCYDSNCYYWLDHSYSCLLARSMQIVWTFHTATWCLTSFGLLVSLRYW